MNDTVNHKVIREPVSGLHQSKRAKKWRRLIQSALNRHERSLAQVHRSWDRSTSKKRNYSHPGAPQAHFLRIRILIRDRTRSGWCPRDTGRKRLCWREVAKNHRAPGDLCYA